MTSINKITESFFTLADPKRAEKMSAYMRKQFKFYGLYAEERRSLYRDFLKAEKAKGEIDWKLLDQAYDDKYRESQYFACDYLLGMKDFLTFEDIPKIESYIRKKSWWDTVDNLHKLVGHISLSDTRVKDLMKIWSKDKDFWIRRVAINHQIGIKENTDPDLLEYVIKNNFFSNEFFINKAIGWSLREYSKTNPLWVGSFIDSYSDQMSKLSIREASKYL